MATKQQIEVKNAEIADLQRMLVEANETMQRKTNRLKELEVQMSQMRSTMQNLEANQKEKDHDIEQVRSNTGREKTRLQDQLHSLKKTNDNLLQKTKSLREQLSTTQKQVGRLQQGRPSTSASQGSCRQCSDLQGQLKETQERLAQQGQQLETVSNEKLNLQQRMDYYYTKFTPKMLATQAAKFVADKDSERTRNQIGELEKLKDDLREEAAALRDQLLTTQQQEGKQQVEDCGQCIGLQDQLNNIREQLAQRYEQLEAVSIEKLHLQQQMDQLVATNKPKIHAFETAKMNAEKDGERLRSLVGDLEKENKQLRNELVTLRDQLKSVQKSGDVRIDVLNEVTELRTKLARGSEAVRAKEQVIRRMHEERAQSETAISDSLLEASMKDTKRMLYSATTGFVVGMLLKCFIR